MSEKISPKTVVCKIRKKIRRPQRSAAEILLQLKKKLNKEDEKIQRNKKNGEKTQKSRETPNQ